MAVFALITNDKIVDKSIKLNVHCRLAYRSVGFLLTALSYQLNSLSSVVKAGYS